MRTRGRSVIRAIVRRSPVDDENRFTLLPPMTLEPGGRLGVYEIVAPIGAGGMGEVYRARDTRLDRSVAIKVLPAELAANAAFKLRFEREAKTISSLSHPNICALYDVGESDSGAFLVMEYLDGETRADRLSKGPIPIDQVLKIGVEIASALDSAHRQGVIHRDLKPGNIMLTRSGSKLLDFGLARSEASGLGASSSSSEWPERSCSDAPSRLRTPTRAPSHVSGLASPFRCFSSLHSCGSSPPTSAKRGFICFTA